MYKQCQMEDKETIIEAIKILSEIHNASYTDGWKEVIVQGSINTNEKAMLMIVRELTIEGE